MLLTDGANTTGVEPVDAAKTAAERGVRVYPIGFGTRNPTTMVCTAAQLGGRGFESYGGGNPPVPAVATAGPAPATTSSPTRAPCARWRTSPAASTSRPPTPGGCRTCSATSRARSPDPAARRRGERVAGGPGGVAVAREPVGGGALDRVPRVTSRGDRTPHETHSALPGSGQRRPSPLTHSGYVLPVRSAPPGHDETRYSPAGRRDRRRRRARADGLRVDRLDVGAADRRGDRFCERDYRAGSRRVDRRLCRRHHCPRFARAGRGRVRPARRRPGVRVGRRAARARRAGAGAPRSTTPRSPCSWRTCGLRAVTVTVASGGASGDLSRERVAATRDSLAAAYARVLDANGSDHLEVDVEQAIPTATVIDALGPAASTSGVPRSR